MQRIQSFLHESKLKLNEYNEQIHSNKMEEENLLQQIRELQLRVENLRDEREKLNEDYNETKDFYESNKHRLLQPSRSSSSLSTSSSNVDVDLSSTSAKNWRVSKVGDVSTCKCGATWKGNNLDGHLKTNETHRKWVEACSE